MNLHLISLELTVVVSAIALLLLDLVVPAERRRGLGYLAALAAGIALMMSFSIDTSVPQYGFEGTYVLDSLSIFFKRLFLSSAILVLCFAVEFSDRLKTGITEFYALILFALAGMMFAASANDFSVLFVSLELITVTFYILASFQRTVNRSLEAGVKYLILGALSSAFLLFGIAFILGLGGSTKFSVISALPAAIYTKPLFTLGVVLVILGLAFKIAAFPMHLWAPDVYQGAPAPVAAFLSTGSKAAGFVLLMRLMGGVIPNGADLLYTHLLVIIAILTILYGNLCALPQRNIKRLLGYSSISNSGYMLLGLIALEPFGQKAVLYYLAGYAFTSLAAFGVITVIMREIEDEDIGALGGLHQRSPYIAAVLAIAFISLAGIPPLAGFFAKVLLIKALFQHGLSDPWLRVLLGATIVGVAISFRYYLGVVKAIYWPRAGADLTPVVVSAQARLALAACVVMIVLLGAMPDAFVKATDKAVDGIRPLVAAKP